LFLISIYLIFNVVRGTRTMAATATDTNYGGSTARNLIGYPAKVCVSRTSDCKFNK